MKHLYRHFLDSYRLDTVEDGREFLAVTESLLRTPELRALSHCRHHKSVSRLQHVQSVAYLTYLICREKGLRAEEAARAALLHDLFYYDTLTYRKKPRRLLYRHPQIALANAMRIYPIHELEEDVITRHMWPLSRPPRTREGRIVSGMDKYCALREFFFSRRIVRRKKKNGKEKDRDRKTETYP